MEELGTRLRGFRLENGWSKRSIAERLGVSTPSIKRWEDGTAEPNDYNRYKIDRLLDGAESGPPVSSRRSTAQQSLFPEPSAAKASKA